MEAKDTVMKSGDLCLKVCQDHRTRTLEAKDCTGLDCEDCQLEAQAEIAFKAGKIEGITLYAWWKDGVQYVGTCGRTLKQAIEEDI